MTQSNKLYVKYITWSESSDYAGHSLFSFAVTAWLWAVFFVAYNNRMLWCTCKFKFLWQRYEKDQVVVNFYISDEYIDRITEGSILELVVNPIGLGSSLIFHQGISSTVIDDDSLIPEKASDEGKKNIASHRVIITDQADSITAVFNSVAELINNVNSLVTDLNGILDGSKTESPLSETISEINTILNQVSMFLAGDDSVPLSKIVDSLHSCS